MAPLDRTARSLPLGERLPDMALTLRYIFGPKQAERLRRPARCALPLPRAGSAPD